MTNSYSTPSYNYTDLNLQNYLRDSCLPKKVNPLTICIGALCENNSKVIVASDKMLTHEGLSVEFEQRTPKMEKLSNFCVALTSGAALLPVELCKKVRERDECWEIPILFLTAKSRDEDRNKGLEVGANLFLSKPISPEKLLQVVSEALG